MPRTPWEISRNMFLSLEEPERVLAHVRGTAGGRAEPARLLDRVIIEGLLFSGLRSSELCALRVGDTTCGAGDSVFIVRNPGGRERVVHLPQSVSALIKRYVVLTRGKAKRLDKTQPLLLNERGKGYERTALYRRVVRILGDAGLEERASVQLLRHTYGYLAYLRTGGNLLFVQRQLGHAHPMITSIYARFVEESYPDLAERVLAGTASHRPSGDNKNVEAVDGIF